MSYATADMLRAAFGLRELLDSGAVLDPARLVDESLLGLVIGGGATDSYSPEAVAAAQAIVERIEGACDQATSRIDSFLRARWASVELPLTAPPADVVRIAISLSRYLMHADVTEDGIVARRYRDAVAELRDFARGMTTLGVAEPSVGGSTTPTAIAPAETFTSALLDTMP